MPNLRSLIPAVVLVAIVIALVLSFLVGAKSAADTVLLAAIIVGALPLIYDVIVSILKKHFGVDILAIVAIISATALQEYWAAVVVLLMLSGGEALESYAIRRAKKDFTALISNAPRRAFIERGGEVVEILAEEVKVGDIVIAKPNDVIPVDGEVVDGKSVVDESRLTGESLPQEKVVGSIVMSGSVNEQGLLKLKALRVAGESKYQQIIRLVEEAEKKRAPFVRLADRYSVWFTALAFTLAIIAWVISQDPVRALSVLVVATPCPLILATPIAFASGISKAAKRGIIVKSGEELEKLAQADVLVFDKTGTLTFGVPQVTAIKTYDSSEKEVVELAASVDQLSTHVLAQALVQEAKERELSLLMPVEFHEEIGQGVKAKLNDKWILVGRLSWVKQQGIDVSSQAQQDHDRARDAGEIAITVVVDNKLVGLLLLEDTIREDVKKLIKQLPSLSIEKLYMMTGDKEDVAKKIAAQAGIDEDKIFSQLLPGDKVDKIEQLKKSNENVVMVGDGVNDAPALTTADVGIALAARGSSAASESADIVILVDKVERVGDALRVAQLVLSKAKQSIFIGIGLSIGLMVFATAGFIAPVAGALLQEVVDIIVILNALQVLFISVDNE